MTPLILLVPPFVWTLTTPFAVAAALPLGLISAGFVFAVVLGFLLFQVAGAGHARIGDVLFAVCGGVVVGSSYAFLFYVGFCFLVRTEFTLQGFACAAALLSAVVIFMQALEQTGNGSSGRRWPPDRR